MSIVKNTEQLQKSTDSVLERIFCIVREVFNLADDHPLSTGMGVYDVVGWDSLGMLQLLNEIQIIFGIEIELEEATNVKLIGDILSIVEKHAK